MAKLRMGLIGCGRMMTNHLKGIDLVDGLEMTAVCDIVPERAEEVAEFLGNNPFVTTDWKKMVDYVDCVLIALPHDLHFECGMFFAAHGKHILMEKPLCNCEEECIRLIEFCEKQKLTLMCAYPVRYWEGIRNLKAEFDSGKYGKPIQMSVWTEQLTGESVEFGSEREWILSSRLGGGQLFSHGCHYVDLLLWFLGDPIEGSHMGTRNGTPWMIREGTSALVMKFANGAVAYHGATWGARGTRMGYDFQIQMEKALLEYDHIAGEIRLYNALAEHVPGEAVNSQSYKVLWTREAEITKETQHEIRHFVHCVKTGEKPLTDGRSALQGLRVIWALYNAEENHKIADLRGLGLKNA